MGKWLAGIAAAIVGGSALWFLTNAIYPHLLHKDGGPPPPDIRVECTPTPSTIAPGGATELTIKVTRNGIPIEGATVKVDWGNKAESQNTVSGGMLRVFWTAPNPSASGYVFPVEANLAGVRTAEGELEGYARTNCQILVH